MSLKEILQEELINVTMIQCALWVWFIYNINEKEPDCGVPLKHWTQSYLLFKIVFNGHELIRLYLRLQEIHFRYKPWHKYVIYMMFHMFEQGYMIYGMYLFLFSKDNKCIFSQDKEKIQSHIYLSALACVLYGMMVVSYGIMIFNELVITHIINGFE